MDTERIKETTLVRSLADVVADVSDLLQKEIRLAKAELADKLSRKLDASLWLVVSGVLGFVGAMLVVQAIVFGLASLGVPLHWSCLIVAAAFGIGAAVAYSRWRSGSREGLTPERTFRQVRKDIATTKEQLS